MKDLISVLYETVRSAEKTVEELADEIGISSNYLYRSTTPGDSGVNFPIKNLVPLMISTKNFSILFHLAHRCGFLIIKPPDIKNSKPTKINSRFQKQYLTLIDKINDFIEKPELKLRKEIETDLMNFQESIEKVKMFIKNFHVLELGF